MSQFDSIIIGGGHNGLVCAAYLAKSGQRVVVLESAASPGGLGASYEFHPGFKASIAHTISHFPKSIASQLELTKYGYSNGSELPLFGLGSDSEPVKLLAGKVSGVNDKDAAAYKSYQKLMNRFADLLKPNWLKTMPRLGNASMGEMMTYAKLGLNMRMMGKKDMGEFLRVASLPARDLMDENFDNPLLKAMLSWDGVLGARMAPRSPNSSVLAMLYRMSGESSGAHSIPSGGVAGLMGALAKCVEAAGGEIRYGSRVASVTVEGNSSGQRVTGVELANGEQLQADRVISAIDPKQTFIDLVGVQHLDIGFTNRIRRLRCDGYVAKLHLALNGRPEFSGLDDSGGRMILASDMDAIEFAYDPTKYGELPEDPVMEVVVPSLADPAMAPEGKHVLSAHVMYVPYSLKGGWNDAAREQIYNSSINVLDRHAPGIRDQIIHGEMLTPADLEASHGVTGGHWHHTEFAMDQLLMMRPTYGAAQYSTPLPGLYLCSAGCHPGGDITGAAGHNAAQEILR